MVAALYGIFFQYGFVFGIANLAAFLTAPFFGRYGNIIGPKILYNSGAFLQAICGIAFGFLTYVNGADLFIGLSYLLRYIDIRNGLRTYFQLFVPIGLWEGSRTSLLGALS